MIWPFRRQKQGLLHEGSPILIPVWIHPEPVPEQPTTEPLPTNVEEVWEQVSRKPRPPPAPVGGTPISR